ncbi:MAG: sulfurtransferase complex subunit TusB [Anaerolineae bacterium]
MLFTVNKAPLSSGSLSSVLRIAPAGAPILLYEDGVYAVLPSAASAAVLSKALSAHPIYALEADLEARGLQTHIDGIQVIDYAGFVELVEQNDVVPWL